MFTAVLAHRLDSLGWRTYWQEYGEVASISLRLSFHSYNYGIFIDSCHVVRGRLAFTSTVVLHLISA